MSIYMKFANINGNSTAEAYKDWIELQSFSWGLTNTISRAHGGGGGAGKSTPADVSVSFAAYYNSPLFFIACAEGLSEHQVIIAFTKTSTGKQVEFERIILTNNVITSYDTSASTSADSDPYEAITIAFESFEMIRKDSPNGQSVDAAFNFFQNG